MPQFLTSLLGTATALTGAELLKQVGVQATRRYAPPTVVAGLELLDKIWPSLLAEGATSSEMEARLRLQLGTLTGSDWTEIRQRFDPAICLDKLSAPTPEGDSPQPTSS